MAAGTSFAAPPFIVLLLTSPAAHASSSSSSFVHRGGRGPSSATNYYSPTKEKRATSFEVVSSSSSSSSIIPRPRSVARRTGATRRIHRDWDDHFRATQMIVFDKDGTLGDCMPALRTWCSEMTKAVRRRCDYTDGISAAHADRIVSDFHSSIGWNSTSNDLMPSAPLSARTWDEIVGISATSLRDSGLDGIDRDEVLRWHRGLGRIDAEDPPLIDDMAGLFEHIRRLGILISICTSDDRYSTDACMRRWNVYHLVDFSICGDEVDADEGKPSPTPLWELCRLAGGISPRECMVVGDTTSDAEMGHRSGAGFVVGVLTGSGTAEQLIRSGADIVLPDVGYLRYLFLPEFCLR